MCSEIDGLTVNPVMESTGMVEFANEACTRVDATGSTEYNVTLYSEQNDIQDLTKYFSRPTALADSILPLGVRSRFFVESFRMSELIAKWTNGASRLSGVHGIRATIVYTLQVSVTPFHQGHVVLSFQHGANHNSFTQFSRSRLPEACTNLPHVRLDVASDTMVQLRVPYLNQFEYSLVANDSVDELSYGTVALNMITFCETVAALTAPTFQLLVHLEDVELFGATPQDQNSVTIQSGKKLAPVTEEFERESHPFSSAAMSLSKTVKWISKGIPAISSIGGPTSWFLAKAAGAIRSFGFAKPTIVSPPARHYRIDNVIEQNVDVASNALVVGPLASNMLRVSPVFAGTDVDEMSLKYVLSQWSQIHFFGIDTTTAARTLVYATPVTPSACWFRQNGSLPSFNNFAPVVSTPVGNSFMPSSLFYFGSMFRYWRGTIKYRFTFAKSKMHGGRIMITYLPQRNDVSDANGYGSVRTTLPVATYGPAAGPSPFGYTKMFSLRDNNVVEFEIPYVSPVPFTNFVNYPGTLAMYVVDPLQAPATCSQRITVLVEVCAGEDFELSNPNGVRYPAAVNGTTIVVQSGKLLGNGNDNLSEYTIGESITSLKQLIMIPKHTLITPVGGSLAFDVPPWYYQPVPSGSVPGPTAHLTESFSYGGNIASCYAFVKGGTDFHSYTSGTQATGTSTGDGSALIAQNITSGNINVANATPARGSDSSMPFYFSTEKAVHYRLPAYQNVVRFLSHIMNDVFAPGTAWGAKGSPSIGGVPYSAFRPQSLYSTAIVSGETTADIFTSRAASDDAAAGLYHGPPPMGLLSANPVARYDVDSLLA